MPPLDRFVLDALASWPRIVFLWLLQGFVALMVIGALYVTDGHTVFEALGDPMFLRVYAGFTLGIGVLQGLLLLPIRRPRPRAARGVSVWLSLVVAGLLVAVLVGAFTVAVLQVLEINETRTVRRVLWGSLGVAWFVGTILFVTYVRSQPHATREHLLGRVARFLLAGTVFEAIATIPLHVILRKKIDCVCAQGSLLTWAVCTAVGTVVLGPAVIFTVLARHRERWYRRRCDACGEPTQALPPSRDYRTTPELRCPTCASSKAPGSLQAK